MVKDEACVLQVSRQFVKEAFFGFPVQISVRFPSPKPKQDRNGGGSCACDDWHRHSHSLCVEQVINTKNHVACSISLSPLPNGRDAHTSWPPPSSLFFFGVCAALHSLACLLYVEKETFQENDNFFWLTCFVRFRIAEKREKID